MWVLSEYVGMYTYDVWIQVSGPISCYDMALFLCVAVRRADVNHCGLHGASALMWAAEESQFEATLPGRHDAVTKMMGLN